MSETNTTEFDARLRSLECDQSIQEIINYLRNLAEQTGPVNWRAHSSANGGWGITGKRGKNVFCRFDPKPTIPHVCVKILGADEYDLQAAGKVHKRKNDSAWVDVTDMRSAKLLEALIARAYAAAGVVSKAGGRHK